MPETRNEARKRQRKEILAREIARIKERAQWATQKLDEWTSARKADWEYVEMLYATLHRRNLREDRPTLRWVERLVEREMVTTSALEEMLNAWKFGLESLDVAEERLKRWREEFFAEEDKLLDEMDELADEHHIIYWERLENWLGRELDMLKRESLMASTVLWGDQREYLWQKYEDPEFSRGFFPEWG